MSKTSQRKRGSRRHHRRGFHLAGKRNAVGERVRALRNRMDLTQTGLAVKCALLEWNIDRQIVAHIEGGTREVSDLELRVLCTVLKTTPNELMGWLE
ncbi:MAG: helix-turn-helix domain-containing protein [Opitutaceae bacterium]|jgi:transcriptional regulator with XRE-family HTH domain|nr:helix-turn-helix domain-containing protein [Opitutaceae bacterium]